MSTASGGFVRLGTFTFDVPPEVLTDQHGDTYNRAEFIVVECGDCPTPLKWDGSVFRCSAQCGGQNAEDGLDPRDIMPEYDEVMTMSENGILLIVSYDCVTEDDA